MKWVGITPERPKPRTAKFPNARTALYFPVSRYPDHPRVGVGAVVFKDDRVLLVKRGRPPAEGHWAVPGGRVELGETLVQAAEREIFEETAVRIRAKVPVHAFDAVIRDAAGDVMYHYVIVDLAADYVSGRPVPGDDASDARWISRTELKALPVNPETRRLLADVYGFGEAPEPSPAGGE